MNKRIIGIGALSLGVLVALAAFLLYRVPEEAPRHEVASEQEIAVGAPTGVGVRQGGTGTTTPPDYGELLVGNANGGYDLRATSTLGISGGSGSGDGLATTSIDTEAELESILTDVTDVFTNNDGALADDDLSDNTTTDLPEGTNLYYTTARVNTDAPNVTLNTGQYGYLSMIGQAITLLSAHSTSSTAYQISTLVNPWTVGSINSTSTTASTFAGLVEVQNWTVSTTTMACAKGCEFTSIQTALNAGWKNVRLKGETYSEQITIQNDNTTIMGDNMRGSTIQCNGSTQSPCVNFNGKNFVSIRDLSVSESGGVTEGIGIDVANVSHFDLENLSIGGFATGTRVHDSGNLTFYGKMENMRWFDNTSCLEVSGSLANNHNVEGGRCRPKSGEGGIGIALFDARGWTFKGTNVEPSNGTGIIGVRVGTTTREITFLNPWIEGSTGTGVEIMSGANRISFFGGTVTGWGTDISNNGTNTTLLGVNRTGSLSSILPLTTFPSGFISQASSTINSTLTLTDALLSRGTATSTFAGGINLTGGCVAVNSVCIGSVLGSGPSYLYTLLDVNVATSTASSTGATLHYSTTTDKWTARNPIVIDVRDHGAVCDGTTDDIEGIQKALNMARFWGGGIVELPQGTCRTSTSTLVYDKTTLRGQGKQATRLFTTATSGALPGGSMIKTGASTDHVTIQGMEIQGHGDSQTSGTGISMPNGVHSFVKVIDVYVHDFPNHGVHLVDPILCAVEDSWLRDNGQDGLFIDIGTTCDIDTVYASGNNRSGIHLNTHTSTNINNSAAEYNTYNFWIQSSGNITLNSPYVEITMRADAGALGLAAAYRIQSSQNITINDGYSNSFAYLSGVPAYHVYVTGSQRIKLNNFRGKALQSAEGGFGEPPTNTLFIESGSGVSVDNINFTDLLGTATSTKGISGTPINTLTDDGAFASASSTPYAVLSITGTRVGSTTAALVPASSQTANILDIYNTSGALTSVLTASHNFGIGTTTPGGKLGVAGDIYATGNLSLSGTNLGIKSAGTANIINDRNATTNFGLSLYRTAGVDQWALGTRNDSTNNFYFRDSVNGRNKISLIQGTGGILFPDGFVSQASSTVTGLFNAETLNLTSVNSTSTIAGGLSVSRFAQFASTTASMFNETIYVDGHHYPQTGAGIQAALNDCNVLSCGHVHMPAGTYAITAQISVSSNIILSGEGASTILRINDSINPTSVIRNSTQTGSGNVNIVLRNFAIDGNGSNNLTNGRGVFFKIVASSTIENLTIYDTRSDGILLDGNDETSKLFKGNKIIGNTISRVLSTSNDGIQMIYGKENIFYNNITKNSGRYGIHVNRSEDNIVEKNIASFNTNAGIELFNASSTKVFANTASNNTQQGIKLESNAEFKTDNNVVSYNTIENNASYGLLGGTAAGQLHRNNSFQGNIIRFNGDDGLVLFKTPFAVADGNTVVGNQDQGIPVDTSLHVVVSNNHIAGNYREGIEVKNGSHYVIVEGNLIKNNGQENSGGETQGIRVETGIQGTYLADNQVFDDQSVKTQTHGILVDSGALDTIVGSNHLHDNATADYLDSSNDAIGFRTYASGTTAYFNLTGANVGIGTTSPSALLSVHGGMLVSGNATVANLTATGTVTASRLTVTNDITTNNLDVDEIATTTFLQFRGTGSIPIVDPNIAAGYMWVDDSGNIKFRASLDDLDFAFYDGSNNENVMFSGQDTEFRINSLWRFEMAGNAFNVSSAGLATMNGFISNASSTHKGTLTATGLTSSATGNAVCITTAKVITDAGGGTCTPSSERFKENVQTLIDGTAIDILGQLRVVQFDYKDGAYSPEDSPTSYGMIAEEVEKVDPNLVDYGHDGKPLTLHFEKIGALVVQAVQDLVTWNNAQDTRLDALEQRIEALEAENAALRAEPMCALPKEDNNQP